MSGSRVPGTSLSRNGDGRTGATGKPLRLRHSHSRPKPRPGTTLQEVSSDEHPPDDQARRKEGPEVQAGGKRRRSEGFFQVAHQRSQKTWVTAAPVCLFREHVAYSETQRDDAGARGRA